jgi:hypothetical protein
MGYKTEWVEMPHGEQLKFAVPEEGLNEEGFLEEIEDEVREILDSGFRLITQNGFSVGGAFSIMLIDVENIFKKYK